MTSRRRSRQIKELEKVNERFLLAQERLRDGLENSGDEALINLGDEMGAALNDLFQLLYER